MARLVLHKGERAEAPGKKMSHSEDKNQKAGVIEPKTRTTKYLGETILRDLKSMWGLPYARVALARRWVP